MNHGSTEPQAVVAFAASSLSPFILPMMSSRPGKKTSKSHEAVVTSSAFKVFRSFHSSSLLCYNLTEPSDIYNQTHSRLACRRRCSQMQCHRRKTSGTTMIFAKYPEFPENPEYSDFDSEHTSVFSNRIRNSFSPTKRLIC